MREAKVEGFRESDFGRDDFMMVTPDIVSRLEGDAVAALVAIRIRYRQRVPENEAFGGYWRASMDALAKDTGLTTDQCRRAVERLVAKGLLEKQRQYRNGVTDQTMSYRLTMVSHPASTPSLDPASTPSLDPASTPSLPSIEEVEEVEEDTSASDADGSLPGLSLVPPIESPRTLEAEFEEWWLKYPRKVNKGAARKVWKSARRKVSLEVLVEAVGRFAVRCRGKDAAYIPHASTWLNGERWLDEDERPAGSKVANGNEEHWRNGGGFWGERRG